MNIRKQDIFINISLSIMSALNEYFVHAEKSDALFPATDPNYLPLTGEKNLSSIPMKEKNHSMNDDQSISSQKANIDALKKILLLAKPLFLQDGHVFLHWMTQCIATWTYLSGNKSDERKISEKI